ncbi:MAG: metallophosphoesterase [Myxococcota bacterium]
MRIAHATDIHWYAPPRVDELVWKRWLGSANLYLLGRRHHFAREVQQQLVAHIAALEPDVVMITGDLTSQALESEFALAREDLAPLLTTRPVFVIPGNHDVYTRHSQRSRAMQRWFGEWMGLGEGGLGRLDIGDLTLLGLDPNRPLALGSSGIVPDTQLLALAEVLADPALARRSVGLAIHYPPIDRRGNLYDGARHGLLNATALIEVLDRAPLRPAFIACGHVHHGFRAPLRLSDGHTIPVCNSGTSGQAFRPDHQRAAAMAVYEVSDNRVVSTERFVHDGTGFFPEPGGSWSTGR